MIYVNVMLLFFTFETLFGLVGLEEFFLGMAMLLRKTPKRGFKIFSRPGKGSINTVIIKCFIHSLSQNDIPKPPSLNGWRSDKMT